MSNLKSYLHREHRLLIALGIGAALFAIFAAVAGEMVDGDTQAFDIAVLKALRTPGDPAVPIGPHWLKFSMMDITALGGTTVLALIAVLAIAFFIMQRRYHHALFTAVAAGGGALFSSVLKSIFDRPRPDVVPHLVEVSSMSFPSGHSMNSAVIYFTLAVLLARNFEQARLRTFIISVAAILVFAIGFSRVYLGVHYPSDVLAGWTAGAAWAIAVGVIATLLQQRDKIEPPTAPAS